MQVLRATVWALLLCGAAAANDIILTGFHTSLGMQESLYFDDDRVATRAYWVGAIDISTYRTRLDLSDTPPTEPGGLAAADSTPIDPHGDRGVALQLAEVPPAVLMLSGIGLILIGSRRRRNSGTIGPHAERPDFRCEELAGHPRR